MLDELKGQESDYQDYYYLFQSTLSLIYIIRCPVKTIDTIIMEIIGWI